MSVLRISAIFLLASVCFWDSRKLLAAPDEGADLSLPSSTDRYVPGLVTGKETEVDRRMEVTEKEPPPSPAEAAPVAPKGETSPAGDEEGFFSSIFKNKTFLNLLILAGIGAVFIVYRLRTGGGSRR